MRLSQMSVFLCVRCQSVFFAIFIRSLPCFVFFFLRSKFSLNAYTFFYMHQHLGRFIAASNESVVPKNIACIRESPVLFSANFSSLSFAHFSFLFLFTKKMRFFHFLQLFAFFLHHVCMSFKLDSVVFLSLVSRVHMCMCLQYKEISLRFLLFVRRIVKCKYVYT